MEATLKYLVYHTFASETYKLRIIYETMKTLLLVATIATVIGSDTLHLHANGTADYKYLGCFRDVEIRDLRVMKDHEIYIPELTIQSCLIECTSAEMAYFGLEQINMCYCGKNESGFQTYGNSSDCIIPCAGNMNQTCGGQFAIDVYKIEIRQCPELDSPRHGNVHRQGDKAWFDCLDGYLLKGSAIIHCNRTNLKWTIPVYPICYIESRSVQPSKDRHLCSALGPPINGKVIQTTTKAWFECLNGYCLQGTNFTNCNTSTLRWDQPSNVSCLKCDSRNLGISTYTVDYKTESSGTTEVFRPIQGVKTSLLVLLIGIIAFICTLVGVATGLLIGGKIILRTIEGKILNKSNDGNKLQTSRSENQKKVSTKYNAVIYHDLSVERNADQSFGKQMEDFVYNKSY